MRFTHLLRLKVGDCFVLLEMIIKPKLIELLEFFFDLFDDMRFIDGVDPIQYHL